MQMATIEEIHQFIDKAFDRLESVTLVNVSKALDYKEEREKFKTSANISPILTIISCFVYTEGEIERFREELYGDTPEDSTDAVVEVVDLKEIEAKAE